METVEDIKQSFLKANEFIQNKAYQQAIKLLKEIMAVTTPLTQKETDDAVLKPFQGNPEQVDTNQQLSENGKPVKYVMDYFTASLYYLGFCQTAMGNFEIAKDSLEQAATLWPDNYTIKVELAFVYSRLQQFNDAVSTLHEAIKIDSQQAQAYRDMIWIYNELNQFEKAIEIGQQAVTAHVNMNVIKDELEFSYKKLGKPMNI